MSKTKNLEFSALNVSGDNYLQWALDVKIALESKNLAECIMENNECEKRSKFKAIAFIHHHLAESLKNQYLTIEDPLDLWVELKNRYDHQKTVLLPKAHYDWKNLRIQDFKSVEEYNSELFKIVSILRLCGEKVTDNDLLEKTYSTFHPNNVVLQQQYRGMKFKTYASLISCLLLAEKNNELLLMNSSIRPPGSTPLPEAHKAEIAEIAKEPRETKETNYVHRGYHGHGRGRGRGGGRSNHNSYGRGNHHGGRGRGNNGRGRGRGIFKPQHKAKSVCHRCGMDNHWAKTCRTSKHLIDAYQEMIKKNPEANLAHLDGDGDFDHEKDDQLDTIAGIASLIEGHGQAHILLSKGTHLEISDALYSPGSKRSLLSFKDIRLNGFHIETKGEGNKEFLNIIEITKGHKKVLETIPALSTGLYYAKIDMIEANMAMNKEFIEEFTLWHDRLGHPGQNMMRKLMTNSKGHTLKEKRVIPKNLTCEACSQGKLIIRPSPAKVNKETLNFLERIQGDICGPIHPPCGTFRYFMVLIDASTRWSHVCLLSTRNQAFARLLAQIIRLRAHFPDFPLKTIRLDNAGEFTSQAFNDYCMSMGVSVEHPVAHVHTQNGLAESFIKRIQLIARPLLMRSKLPVAAWGHAVLHSSELIRIRPSSEHKYSPSQLLMGHEPDISHLKTFGCAVYVPIAPPHRTKMGPQRRMGIYVGFDSPTIIKYLEPTTGDLFKARYADCHFNESEFPTLGGETNKLGKDINEISWNQTSLNWQDPRTLACESEVQKIINLQKLANELPDSFVDPKKVTKSYIPACNAPVRIDIQKGINEIATESNARKKRGRPLGSKDKNPRKSKKGAVGNEVKETIDMAAADPKEPNREIWDANPHGPEGIDENEKSINYIMSGIKWNRKDVDIDEIFAYKVAIEINEDHEPTSILECTQRSDWLKWKEAINVELSSLKKRDVFGPILRTPSEIKPVGHKWVFVRKRNENNEIVRHKARLVAQGFSQRPGIDYEETYSPVVDATTFRFLISLAIREKLDLRLMDVVTAYLYGPLDNEIYMRLPEGIELKDKDKKGSRDQYCIRLNKSLYGLKQSGRMWYNRLSDYLVREGYKNDPISPCIFIKKFANKGFVIIAVYVDDLNILGTSGEITQTVEYLKKEFEMKDLGKTKFCLGLQLEYVNDGILVHQKAYTEKVLKRFNMDKAHPLSSPMVVRSLGLDSDPFGPKKDEEEVLGPEVPYLSAIGALMYLASHTRPDICFAVNLLSRFSSCPTQRHWNGIKQLLRYLQGTVDLGLFYTNHNKEGLVGFADAGYLSDPHNGKSQTGYVFTHDGTAISWRSMKQTISATSSNHAEILAIHEASRECVWLRSMTQHIRSNCGMDEEKEPTVMYEDNAACIAQLKDGYIKGDRTKHILPKFFFTHDLQRDGEVRVVQVQSLLKLTPPSYKKASPAPIRTMKVRGNENWSEKSSISTREASPAPIRTMKVRANENWSEKSSISTRKASPAPIRTMKVRGNENWYEKSSISTSNRQPAPIRTMKVRGIENWYEKSSISTSNRQPVRGMVEKKKRSVRWIVDQYASGRPAGRGNTILGRPRVPPYSVPDVGSDRGILSGGMTDRLSDPVLGQKLLSGRGEWACHAWDDTDSSRPWGGGILGKRMAVGGGIFGMRPKYRDVPMGIDSTRLGWMVVLRWKAWIRLGCPELSKFTFCGCSWQPSFDGKWISAGSDTRLPVSCVSFALRLRYSQPRLDGPEYFGGVGERLMFLGQLNVRRMSGDRIASVCRLRARAPNYLPPILLSYFTGDVTLDDRIRGLFKKLVVEPWDGSAGPPLVCTGRLVPSVGDTLLVLIGRDFDPIVLAFGIGVMINRDSRGHSYFIVRERKLGARRRSDTVLVSTINDADQGSADVAYRTPLAPYEKSKFLGSGGSMVARLKLKGIDGRAPPGVCDALRCSGPHARYTDVFNEFTPWPTGPVSASHQLALTTSLPFVHTARRSYRLNDPVKCSDRGDVGGSPPATIIVDTCPKQNDPRTNDHHSRWAGFLTDPVLAGSVVSRIALVGSFISVLSCALLPDITKPRHEKCQGTSKRTAGIRLPGDGVCADAVLRYKV
ncbi:GAG-pre-integrase domain [Arabidopsis suecica]|uniref:GAG-pre-integrase domain n=1 Tax=Arabidopsis suecica TaxID=45249 RepID=A0A8T1XB22_ARASU|nr:GAG-pre-integrase domain [Arabidopsis suecica]